MVNKTIISTIKIVQWFTFALVITSPLASNHPNGYGPFALRLREKFRQQFELF